MIRSRHGIKALGLCALVIGLMAIGTGAAQAEVGSFWRVEGNKVTEELKVEVAASLENNHSVLLSKALGASFNILCTAVELESFLLKIEGKSLGKLKFTGCKILLNGSVSAACEPHTGTEKGVILTVPLKDLIILGSSGEALDLLAPEEGTVFVSIETGPECAVGAKIPVIGEFVFKDCHGEFQIENVIHLVEEGPGTELFVISKTVEHKATIDGSANTFLIGNHLNKKWSGIPG